MLLELIFHGATLKFHPGGTTMLSAEDASRFASDLQSLLGASNRLGHSENGKGQKVQEEKKQMRCGEGDETRKR